MFNFLLRLFKTNLSELLHTDHRQPYQRITNTLQKASKTATNLSLCMPQPFQLIHPEAGGIDH